MNARSTGLALLVLGLLQGCGGGGGGGGGTVEPKAPCGTLWLWRPATLSTGIGGAHCTLIDGQLPSGMSLNESSCTIPRNAARHRDPDLLGSPQRRWRGRNRRHLLHPGRRRSSADLRSGTRREHLASPRRRVLGGAQGLLRPRPPLDAGQRGVAGLLHQRRRAAPGPLARFLPPGPSPASSPPRARTGGRTRRAPSPSGRRRPGPTAPPTTRRRSRFSPSCPASTTTTRPRRSPTSASPTRTARRSPWSAWTRLPPRWGSSTSASPGSQMASPSARRAESSPGPPPSPTESTWGSSSPSSETA